jgi:hypothetical protein
MCVLIRRNKFGVEKKRAGNCGRGNKATNVIIFRGR